MFMEVSDFRQVGDTPSDIDSLYLTRNIVSSLESSVLAFQTERLKSLKEEQELNQRLTLLAGLESISGIASRGGNLSAYELRVVKNTNEILQGLIDVETVGNESIARDIKVWFIKLIDVLIQTYRNLTNKYNGINKGLAGDIKAITEALERYANRKPNHYNLPTQYDATFTKYFFSQSGYIEKEVVTENLKSYIAAGESILKNIGTLTNCLEEAIRGESSGSPMKGLKLEGFQAKTFVAKDNTTIWRTAVMSTNRYLEIKTYEGTSGDTPLLYVDLVEDTNYKQTQPTEIEYLPFNAIKEYHKLLLKAAQVSVTLLKNEVKVERHFKNLSKAYGGLTDAEKAKVPRNMALSIRSLLGYYKFLTIISPLCISTGSRFIITHLEPYRRGE